MAPCFHSDEVAPQTWPSVRPALLLNRRKENERARDGKTDKFELQNHFSFPPPLLLAASMFPPLSSRLRLSPPLCELLGMRGSHSLCVVISIDLSAVQQPFPADFLSFALPPFLTLYPLIVPPSTSTHPSLLCSCSTVKFQHSTLSSVSD